MNIILAWILITGITVGAGLIAGTMVYRKFPAHKQLAAGVSFFVFGFFAFLFCIPIFLGFVDRSNRDSVMASEEAELTQVFRSLDKRYSRIELEEELSHLTYTWETELTENKNGYTVVIKRPAEYQGLFGTQKIETVAAATISETKPLSPSFSYILYSG